MGRQYLPCSRMHSHHSRNKPQDGATTLCRLLVGTRHAMNRGKSDGEKKERQRRKGGVQGGKGGPPMRAQAAQSQQKLAAARRRHTPLAAR